MRSVVLLLASLAALTCCHGYSWEETTALDEYVNREDGVFSWQVLTQYRFDEDNCTVYILNMTSCRWMDDSFSDSSIWWHFMGVSIPDVIKKDFSYLFIDGGHNNVPGNPPGETDTRVNIVRHVARVAGYVGAFLLQIPNQPVRYYNDPTGGTRSEDGMIAWTWKTYIDAEKPVPEMIARMPMTKAGKRALDTINALVLRERPGHNIKEFAVGGGSKRGWTAWSVAATDRRVVAVTPIVMSLMNFNDTLQAHYRSLGGWTFVFSDYYNLNLTQRFHEDLITNWEYGVWTYEDMFRYKERLELIPKLIVSATGDEFFLCTDSHNWWNQMGGPKWLSMVPNAEHSLIPWHIRVGETIAAWLILINEPTPAVPRMAWLRGPSMTGGRVLLNVDTEPDEVTAWTATTWRNSTRRDFRLAIGIPPYIHPVLWSRMNVTNSGPLSYEIDVAKPEIGYTGVFIDCLYTRLVEGVRLHLTTEVQITPDDLPFPPCYGEACYGVLT